MRAICNATVKWDPIPSRPSKIFVDYFIRMTGVTAEEIQKQEEFNGQIGGNEKTTLRIGEWLHLPA